MELAFVIIIIITFYFPGLLVLLLDLLLYLLFGSTGKSSYGSDDWLLKNTNTNRDSPYGSSKQKNNTSVSKLDIAKKLLKDTGSKRITKDILIKKYGCSISEAKHLAHYKDDRWH